MLNAQAQPNAGADQPPRPHTCPSCGRPMTTIVIRTPLQDPPQRVIHECRACGLKMSPLHDDKD